MNVHFPGRGYISGGQSSPIIFYFFWGGGGYPGKKEWGQYFRGIADTLEENMHQAILTF